MSIEWAKREKERKLTKAMHVIMDIGQWFFFCEWVEWFLFVQIIVIGIENECGVLVEICRHQMCVCLYWFNEEKCDGVQKSNPIPCKV